jgi:choline dehydrogenase-like flavoprotein
LRTRFGCSAKGVRGSTEADAALHREMGHDEMAVTDPAYASKGIDGLRVIDASIMPKLISGNTQAPSIMIGEKGAALVLQNTGDSSARVRPEDGAATGLPSVH